MEGDILDTRVLEINAPSIAQGIEMSHYANFFLSMNIIRMPYVI